MGVEKKIIIAFEDIQWADPLTIKLIIRLILHINSNVLFILTKSDEVDEKVDKYFFTLKDLEKLSIIQLKPFDKKDVNTIVKKVLGNKLDEREIEEIYIKSKGNAFFLKEYIELFKNGEKKIE